MKNATKLEIDNCFRIASDFPKIRKPNFVRCLSSLSLHGYVGAFVQSFVKGLKKALDYFLLSLHRQNRKAFQLQPKKIARLRKVATQFYSALASIRYSVPVRSFSRRPRA